MASRDNSKDPTPYAVRCLGPSQCGLVFLTPGQYSSQMKNPNAKWYCTNCGDRATWDDDCQETNPPEEGGTDGGM